jgi:hypothetical protein
MEVDIPLTHQSLGPVHKELPGLLLEPPHHWLWWLYPADIQAQVFSDPEVTISAVLLWNSLEMFIPPSRQCILACSQMVSLCCTTHDTCLCVAHAVQNTVLYVLNGVGSFTIHPRLVSMWHPCVPSPKKALKGHRLQLDGDGKWFKQQPKEIFKEGFIGRCSSEVLASVPMVTISNSIF